MSEANNAVIQIRNVKQQVAERLAKSPTPALKAAGDRLTKGLSAIEEEIYQVRNQSGQDPLNFPIKINNRIASLLRVVNTGDGKPIFRKSCSGMSVRSTNSSSGCNSRRSM